MLRKILILTVLSLMVLTERIIVKTQRDYSISTETVSRKCSVKKLFLKTLQNLQETPVPESLLIKLQAPSATLLKKRLWHRCFPVNLAKFLRTRFFIEHFRWLLLILIEN